MIGIAVGFARHGDGRMGSREFCLSELMAIVQLIRFSTLSKRFKKYYILGKNEKGKEKMTLFKLFILSQCFSQFTFFKHNSQRD
jgi:hypothetical protein